MTAFSSAGTNVPIRVVFNSGTLDFGASRIVDVDNLSVKVEGTTDPLYVLGSVLPQDLVRHSMKFTLTGKAKSFPAELMAMAFGSSVIGTPNEFDILDGQPTMQNPVLTLFDRNSKQIQYQFSNAVFKSTTGSFKMEDYAEFDFELDARNVVILQTV